MPSRNKKQKSYSSHFRRASRIVYPRFQMTVRMRPIALVFLFYFVCHDLSRLYLRRQHAVEEIEGRGRGGKQPARSGSLSLSISLSENQTVKKKMDPKIAPLHNDVRLLLTQSGHGRRPCAQSKGGFFLRGSGPIC